MMQVAAGQVNQDGEKNALITYLTTRKCNEFKRKQNLSPIL